MPAQNILHANPSGRKRAASEKVHTRQSNLPLPPTSKEDGYLQYYGNIMADPRIWRRNTFDLYKKSNTEKLKLLKTVRSEVVTFGVIHRTKQAITSVAKPAAKRRKFRPAEKGDQACSFNAYKHLVLEEISDRPIELDTYVQVEQALHRPKTPVFTPATITKDASTEIKHGDLFVFGHEVKALLELVVGQAIEQALLETSQEEELLVHQEERRLFQEMRNVQHVELQRLMAAELRKNQEKELRLQERELLTLEQEDHSRNSAMLSYAKTYVQELIPCVYYQLLEEGRFDNPIYSEMDYYLTGWLQENVDRVMDEYVVFNFVTQDLVKQILQESSDEATRRVIAVQNDGHKHHSHKGHLA